MTTAVAIVLRLLCSFNAIALALLAFQNAGYIVLMGYAQQLQNTPPAPGESPRKKFSSTHFIAVTELVKLVICSVWCMADVVLDMQRSEQEAAEKVCLYVYAEEDDAAFVAREAAMEHSSPGATPAMWPAALALQEVAAPPSARTPKRDEYSLRRILSRPNFTAQFGVRLRHAIGFDEKYKEALLMVVPAVLYTIQGLLLILALQYLDPTVFQILYQVRIMFLAVMMRAALDFKLSPVRWVALVALMVGIILAQLAMQQQQQQQQLHPAKATVKATVKPRPSWSVEGTMAALTGAFMSSFSGVFTEYLYKKRSNVFTLSARSIHLAFFSLVYFALVFTREALRAAPGVVVAGGKAGSFFASFFDGFTGLVWFLVFLQATGGILVGVVVRYCDNIVKSFSTAFAIVLSGTASVFLFDLPLGPMFATGSLLVMGSITVYSLKK